MNFRPILTGTALLVALPAYGQNFERAPRNTDLEPAFEGQFRAPLETSDVALEVTDIATGLEHPWGFALLPEDAGYLVTERPGRLRHVAEDGTLSEPIAGMPEVAAMAWASSTEVAVARSRMSKLSAAGSWKTHLRAWELPRMSWLTRGS